ncbi:MAG: PD-(D/E)XK nuclease family protein, partial [Chloroflexota bacterium]
PLLNVLSQSSLQDYADCARRFQLRYLERLRYPAVESEPALENEKHQQEGEYFHRLAQQRFLGIPTDKLARLANTPNLQRWWENFFATDFGFGDYTKNTEFTLSAPLDSFRLVAKYDLIAIKPGTKAMIFDWKTYRKRPGNEWLATRWQTRVYRALLVQAGASLNGGVPFQPEQIEMTYWFADFPSEAATFPYNATLFKRDWDALTKVAQEIRSASDGSTALATGYPKTDDRQKCSYCPYRGYCDRGVRAGEGENIETETEAEEMFDINFEQIGEIAF